MQAPLMAAITGFWRASTMSHDRGQERLRVERAAGEFLDVGAAREGAFVADEHDGAHLGVGERAIERVRRAPRATRATTR